MDGGAAVYAYDGEGRRMKKTAAGVTTYFFYGPGGLISEFDTVSGPTQAAATDKPNYRTSDKLGTAVLLIAASGTVIENNRTLPYGELWTNQINSSNNEKFTTYERDQESGLDHAERRSYQSNASRFLSLDPGEPTFDTPQSWNRYSYVMNDPVNYADPGGALPFGLLRLTVVPPFPPCYSISGQLLPPNPFRRFVVDMMILAVLEATQGREGTELNCEHTAFTDGIGTYTAADLNAALAVIMGEGSPHGSTDYGAEYHAIGSTLFNRTDRRNDGRTSTLAEEASNGQFEGYGTGVTWMNALAAGDASVFVSRNDPTGVCGYRAACQKLGAARTVVTNLANGGQRDPYHYFLAVRQTRRDGSIFVRPAGLPHPDFGVPPTRIGGTDFFQYPYPRRP